MLDEGVYSWGSEIGDAEDISKSYASRILRATSRQPQQPLEEAHMST
jgi:hypothetical protein